MSRPIARALAFEFACDMLRVVNPRFRGPQLWPLRTKRGQIETEARQEARPLWPFLPPERLLILAYKLLLRPRELINRGLISLLMLTELRIRIHRTGSAFSVATMPFVLRAALRRQKPLGLRVISQHRIQR